MQLEPGGSGGVTNTEITGIPVSWLVEKAGGTVTGRMAVLAEGGAADRKDILFLEKLPVFNADGSVK